MSRPILLLLPMLGLLACTDKGATGDAGDDTGGGDDGGSGVIGDGGCILVDGQAGFSSLADAIDFAPDGATLNLAPCSGELLGPVEIDREMTLQGGPDVRIVSTEGAAITISADGVRLRDLLVEGAEDAIVVEEAANVSLTDVEVLAAGAWGIKAENTADLALTGVHVTGAGSGGFRIDGGSADVSGCTFVDVADYGVRVRDGATVSIGGSTISGVTGASSSSGQTGLGIAVEDASLVSNSNRVMDVTAWGIFGVDADLVLNNDQISDAAMGVYAEDSTLTATGLEIVDALWTGIYAYSGSDAIVISDTSVVGTPGIVEAVDPDSWFDQPYIGAGMFLIAPDLDIRTSSVTGYGGVGILGSANSGTAVLQQVEVSGVDQYGIYMQGLDVTAIDVTVQDIPALDQDDEELCFTVDRDVAVLQVEGSLAWTGGAVKRGGGYGISAVFADVGVDGADIADNRCAGVMLFGSGGSVIDSDLSGAHGEPFGASITTYQGTGLIATGNHFHDSAEERVDWSSEYGHGEVTRYDYYAWYGSDIQLYFGGEAQISDNTFENGTFGVEVYSDVSYGYSSAVLTDNTFENYQNTVLYASPDSTVQATGLTVDTFAAYPLVCFGASMQLEDVALDGGGTLTEHYEVYVDDVLTDDVYYASYGPALYAEDCQLSADGLDIDNVSAWAVYLYGGDATINDLAVQSAGSAADLDGVTVDGSDLPTSLALSSSTLSSIDRYGLVAIASATGGVDMTVSGTTISSTGVVGALFENTSSEPTDGQVQLTNSTVTSPGIYGVYSLDFDVRMDTVSTSGATSHGIQLGGGNAELKTVTSYDNAGYGLYCQDDPVFSACTYTGLDNALGPVSGCDDSCSAE